MHCKRERVRALALALAILFLAPCALAVNPDPVSPPDNPCAPETPGVTSADAGGGCPCQQRANQCRAGEDPQGARAETADGSRWNFLSGRFEQEILLRVGCAGLAMPALRLQHAPGFAPLAHNSPFGDYWHLDAGEYLAPALGGGDGLQWHALNARARAFRPDGKGGYHSHPDRLTTLEPVSEGGAEFLVMRYGKNESKRYRKVASPDGWAHWRLERFDVPGRASLAFRHDAAGRLSAIERAADGATAYALEIDGATGLCRRITDATGATVAEFSYDARRLLTGIDLGEGRRWAFAYDGEGRMSSKARPNGGVVKYFWGEATGRLCKVEYADGTAQAVEYLRDPAGGAERVTVSHRLPAAALAAFDGRPAPAGRLAALCGGKVDVFTVPAGREQFTEARYADGKVVTKAYDGDGQVTRRDGGCAACDGGKSLVEEYAYQNGRLSSVAYRTREGQVLARESYSYDAGGLLAAATARDGGATRHERDAAGRVTRTVHPDGSSEAFAYDGEGRPTSATDELGRVTRYEHDALGRRVATVAPDGGRTVYGYDALGRESSVTYPDGATVTMKYDTIGYLSERTDPLGRVEKWTNDVKGNHLSHTDALGNVTRYEYDGQWRLTKTIFPDGTYEERQLDGEGRVTATRRRDGSVVRKEYDMWGRATAEVGPDGAREERQYDADGRLAAVKDAAGRLTVFEHDAWGNVTRTTDALGNATTATFDAMGRRTSFTDALGATTRFAYDRRSRLISIIDPLGNETRMEHDAAGNLTKQVAPNGVVTLHEYDAMNREIKTIVSAADAANAIVSTREYDVAGRAVRTVQDAGEGRANLTTTMVYGDDGRVAQRTAPDGKVTSYTYDLNGNQLTQSVTAGGATLTTKTEYDALNRPVVVTGPDGLVTKHEYDAAGRTASVTNAFGTENAVKTVNVYDQIGRTAKVVQDAGGANESATSYAHDANGNLVEQTDATGRKVKFAYDALNRRVSVTDALGNIARATYNGRGQQLTATDANGRTKTTVYDLAGRPTEQANEMGQKTRYGYDKLGNRLTLTDANGNVTRWTFDVFGRETSMTFPNGDKEVYEYDRLGWMTAKTKPDGTVIRYEYDRLGRLVKIVTPDGAITYEYDAWGRVVKEVSPTRTLVCEYDRLGRLTAVADSFTGKTVRYAYNRLGAREKATLDGIDVTYKYDRLLRLSEVQKSGEAAPAKYEYDPAGRRVALKLPNGVTTTYAHDGAGRLTRIESKNAAGNVISAFGYTLDATGNRTAMDVTLNGIHNHIEYAFDNAYRLTRETRKDAAGQTLYDENFTFDPVGNRLTRNRTQQFNGQMVTENTNYAYNNANQLLTETTNGVTTAYGYDKNGNNTTISTPAANGVPAKNIAMAYDWLNRQTKWTDGERTESTVFAGADWKRASTTVSGAGVAAQTVKYLYDGDNVLADYDANNALTAFYVTPGLDQNLSITDASGATSYYTQDGLGSVRLLTSANGAILNRYDYTAFGETFATNTANTVSNRYTYTAREQSPLAAHGAPMHYRWRNYAPQIGRFMWRDPIGYDGGANVYGYVCLNNTLISTDPYGLFDDLRPWVPNANKQKLLFPKYWDPNSTPFTNPILGHFSSDWAGKEILIHWLNGTGKDWNIKDDARWTHYLKSSPPIDALRAPSRRALINLASSACKKKIQVGEVYNDEVKLKPEFQNGEGIIGYMYLHGPNPHFSVNAQYEAMETITDPDCCKIKFTKVVYTWLDRMDPNEKYATDALKSWIGKKLGGKDYNISISFTETEPFLYVETKLGIATTGAWPAYNP